MSKKQVYDALSEMRRLSELQQPFSFTFMSWSQDTQSSHGPVEVRSARLKRRTQEATYKNAEIIEEYIDLDTMEHRKFYQPLLMIFNGQKLELKNEPNR